MQTTVDKTQLVANVPKRIIARLDVKNGRVVKGIMMEGVQAVGDPVEMSIRYYEQGADELILLDTVASLYDRLELPHIISEIVNNIFIPVCAGGGITSCHDAERLFFSGADKICVNTAAVHNPQLLMQLSREFGAQSVVLQLDARFLKGKWRVFYNSGRDMIDLDVAEWLDIAQSNGIGEVLVTSIEKDGTGRGPDLPLINLVEKHVRVPIIYGGGVSQVDHIEEILSHRKISAVALASYLHIENADLSQIKSGLNAKGIAVRGVFENEN
jgi:cyclase